mmetsp:Transcript_53152/g.142358  ORF Transcript_53152/g.142358 Transcript_53152/m.142358 type:complete len:311 (+) Transcript_53152:322-1254(+)
MVEACGQLRGLIRAGGVEDVEEALDLLCGLDLGLACVLCGLHRLIGHRLLLLPCVAASAVGGASVSERLVVRAEGHLKHSLRLVTLLHHTLVGRSGFVASTLPLRPGHVERHGPRDKLLETSVHAVELLKRWFPIVLWQAGWHLLAQHRGAVEIALAVHQSLCGLLRNPALRVARLAGVAGLLGVMDAGQHGAAIADTVGGLGDLFLILMVTGVRPGDDLVHLSVDVIDHFLLQAGHALPPIDDTLCQLLQRRRQPVQVAVAPAALDRRFVYIQVAHRAFTCGTQLLVGGNLCQLLQRAALDRCFDRRFV